MEKKVLLLNNDEMTNRMINANNTIVYITAKACKWMATPMRLLRRYYSYALEREVTDYQTKVLTITQIAFFATIIPANIPLLLRCAACVWFITSLRSCRKCM